MPSWKLSRRHEACSRCERPFEEDQRLYSTLYVTAEEIRREDVCEACFPQAREQDGDELIFWRGRHHVGKKAFAVDFEALEGLFLALEGREEQALRELRYLLCLLLMRKKRLKLIKTARRPDGEAMIMRRPRRTEELLIYVFDLTPEKADELRGKLRAIFEGAALEELMKSPEATPEEAPTEDGEPDSEASPEADASQPQEEGAQAELEPEPVREGE
ncbi:MAG: hypothetical protein AAF682_32605 [Planctomycetota bacterium]